MTDILIPELSENIKSGTVTNITVQVNSTVAKGQTLLELETEKAVLEVPSPLDGIVAEILIKAGDQVKPGQLAFRFQKDTSEHIEIIPPVPAAPVEEALQAPAAEQKLSLPELNTLLVNSLPTPSDVPAAPSVRRFARELGINIAEVQGTDPHQRITIEDVNGRIMEL